MDYNVFRERVYYIGRRRLFQYVLLALVVFGIFKFLLGYNIEVTGKVILIFKLIIIIILLTLTIHLKNMTRKKVYSVLEISLVIMFIITIVFLTPKNQLEIIKKLFISLGYNDYFEINFFNTAMIYYMLSKYRMSEKEGSVFLEYSLLFVIVSFFSFMNQENKYYSHVLETLIFLSATYIEIYKNNFKISNKIDLLRLNVNITAISFISNVLLQYDKVSFLKKGLRHLESIIFISTILITINNIIKENYNLVFKETIDTNKKLEQINKEIINNNYKLEKAYKSLNKKQYLYIRFLRSLPDPVIILHDNLRIYYCNESFLKLIKKDNLRNVVNKKIYNYINFNCDIKNIIENINNNEHSITVDKDNKRMEVKFLSLGSEESKCMLLLKDLTEEIKLDSMRKELESMKLKEQIKNNFLSNISYNLKIPVSNIYSASQLEKVLVFSKDFERIRHYNKRSKENCFAFTRLINNIIDLSKINSENLQTNLILDNIVEFIEDYIYILTPYINENGIKIVFDTDEEDIFIYFDKEMMERIILNLISNSLKFTKDGGTIFVNIKNRQGVVFIEVGDNGEGMNLDSMKTFFENYKIEDKIKEYNNHDKFSIGLFVVYNLVKAQGGDIQISSFIGKGTIFNIKLNK